MVAFNADVSIYDRLSFSARAVASSRDTLRWSTKSDLFPTKTIGRSAGVCRWTSSIQFVTWSNESCFVKSNTAKAPSLPR